MPENSKMVTVEKTIHIASDGKEFDDKTDCVDYEWDLCQVKKEENVSHLLYNVNNANWSSIANPSYEHECKWFKIKNDEDLKLFCDAYRAYCGVLENFDYVKTFVSYPDCICFIDYPNGPEFPEWHVLSRMVKETNEFLSHFNLKIDSF